MGYNILFFPWRDWNSMKREGFRTREANLLKAMIDNPNIDKILCVNRSKVPSYIKGLINLKNGGAYDAPSYSENKEEIIYSNHFSKMIKISEKLYILDIDYHLPNPKGNRLERFRFFGRKLQKQIEKALNFLSLDNYLTWCFDLTRIEIANHFKNKLLIFDAIDNLLEHDQNKSDTKYLAHMYKTANDNAQLIFTVSKDLRNKLFINHNNAYYIPNAINIREYQEIHHKSDYYRPSDLPNGPLVGYIGLMQERVNIDILKECIEKNPLINFVFVGPILSKKYFQPIKHYQNVYFLGAKHHSHIPKYLIHFDICLIPHKVNKFTKSMNPLKLYEYLAAGKEVITTSVPPSSDFKNVIHISDDKKEFSKKISECIKTPYLKFSKEEIMNSVKNEDWNIRLSEMLKHVEKQLLR